MVESEIQTLLSIAVKGAILWLKVLCVFHVFGQNSKQQPFLVFLDLLCRHFRVVVAKTIFLSERLCPAFFFIFGFEVALILTVFDLGWSNRIPLLLFLLG